MGERYEDEFQLSYYPIFQDSDPDIIFDSAEETICEVWGTEHDGEANSAFIAAANPEMIEKLVELIELQHRAFLEVGEVGEEATETRRAAYRLYRTLVRSDDGVVREGD